MEVIPIFVILTILKVSNIEDTDTDTVPSVLLPYNRESLRKSQIFLRKRLLSGSKSEEKYSLAEIHESFLLIRKPTSTFS